MSTAVPEISTAVYNPLLLSESERNREHKKCTACGKLATSFCARCKFTPYCGSDCQRSHWSAHKQALCAPSATPSESRDIVSIASIRIRELAEKGTFPADWERPYNYVFLAPGEVGSDIKDSIALVQGVAVEELLIPRVVSDASLLARFQWNSFGTKAILRGYSHEDVFIFNAWASDTFSSSLSANAYGSMLIFTDGCRGGILMEKCLGATGERRQITRREVWEIMIVRSVSSTFGVLPDRIMRENMRRREAVSHFKDMGFKTFGL